MSKPWVYRVRAKTYFYMFMILDIHCILFDIRGWLDFGHIVKYRIPNSELGIHNYMAGSTFLIEFQNPIQLDIRSWLAIRHSVSSRIPNFKLADIYIYNY